jgi:uncharacterized membrane-anchored protein YhcB (DUF1043 family)
MGFEFTPNEWLIVLLAVVFGMLVGAALAMGGSRKHKARYREEARRNAELQRENERLVREAREMDSLRGAAARSPVREPEGRRGIL